MNKGLGYWVRKIPSAVVNRSRLALHKGYGRFISLPVHRHGVSARSFEIREAMFKSAPDDTILIADTGQEIFVISSRDQVIGRSMFVSRAPYDFHILERAHGFVSRTHQVNHIVDIGANIGPICIAGIKRGLFETATAIEPEPGNFRLLSANVYLNGLSDRITRHAVALGDRDDQVLSFALSKDHNHGDHRVHHRAMDSGRQLIEVPSRRLDTLLPTIDPERTLLWMDVQGYEGHVLAGATFLLAMRPPLVFEFWPSEIEHNGSYNLIRTALLDSGYSRFSVLNSDAEEMSFSGEALDALYERLKPSTDHIDLVMR